MIAIVGCGGSCGAYLIESIHGARFEQVWALNDAILLIKHDLGFVIDDINLCLKDPDSSLLVDRIAETDTPFFTSREDERWPMGQRYPLDDVITDIGDDLFNNIGCYALAYGIFRGKDMTLYGLDYYWDGHGTYERGGQAVSYLIGRARERGLKVNITAPSPLLDTNTARMVDGRTRRKLYGYKEQPDMSHLPSSVGIIGAPL